MGLALRVLGLLVFVAAVAGATYGAYQVFEPEGLTAVELTAPSGGEVSAPAGGTRAVSINVANTGETDVNVTLRSQADGVVFDQLGATTVAAGQTRQVAGQLDVSGLAVGTHAVRLQAVDASTERVLGGVTLQVTIFEPIAPRVTLEPMVPAVVPGGQAVLLAIVENPAPSSQQVLINITGATGQAAPPRANVAAGGSARIKVTVQVPGDATGMFTPGVEASAGSASETGRASVELPVVAPGELFASAVLGAVEVAPDGQYSVPFILVADLAAPTNVTVAADRLAATTFATLDAPGATGGFVTFDAPRSLPDQVATKEVTFTAGTATATASFEMRPVGDARRAQAGTLASVNYIGRLTSGDVFDSSLSQIVLGPFPKANFFQERLETRPLDVDLNPQRPSVIAGFFDGVLGMREGEAGTVSIPPAQAYGGERVHQNLSATTLLEREPETERFLRGFQFFELPPEFDIENREVGDIIPYEPRVGDITIHLRFRVVEKTDTTVDLERVEEIGDKVTLYPSFPNMTEVVEVTDTTIRFRTTPSGDVADGPFTWVPNQQNSHQQGWGETTTVRSVNETQIVLGHAPEVGTTYLANSAQGPAEFRVEAVTDDLVQVSSLNPSPLAGQTLVFDIFVVEVREGQAASPITIGGH